MNNMSDGVGARITGSADQGQGEQSAARQAQEPSVGIAKGESTNHRIILAATCARVSIPNALHRTQIGV